MVLPLEILTKEIINDLKKMKITTGTGILTRCVWKYTNDIISGEQISDALKVLVERGDLIDLYPKNVKPESAGMSETFYALSNKFDSYELRE